MKKVTQAGLITMAGAIGKIATPRQALISMAAAAALLLPASQAFGIALDLTSPYPNSGTINGAIYSTIDNKPTGTGVFDPFLSLQAKVVEQGYNTSQGGNGQGFLDTKRVPQWNHDLHLNELTVVPGPDGKGSYYAFELDANETGNGTAARLLSIDNIRVYTSPTDTALSVGNDLTKIALDTGGLGTLRYAQNPLFTTPGVYDTANTVKIDASKSEGGSTSGSGSSDMIVYIPTSNFAGAGSHDFVYFYNLNGVNLTSDAGFEEWRALTTVPDGGSSLVLLGSALTALGIFAGRRNMGTSV